MGEMNRIEKNRIEEKIIKYTYIFSSTKNKDEYSE
jgi:hypothetical protein